MTLAKRVAIVTGASAGIGRATAILLAKAGAAVVASARRGEKLGEVVKEIEANGGKALAVVADASKAADIDVLIKRARRCLRPRRGQLDIVDIVNAGRGLAGGLLSSDRDQLARDRMRLMCWGRRGCCGGRGRFLWRREAGILWCWGAFSGHNSSAFSGFYGSTKFAIAGMAEAFRREVCAKGVQVMRR